MVTGLLYTMQVTRKKNNNFDFTNVENCIISIQISLDGFSFCILNTDLQEVIALASYDFLDKNPTPEIVLSNLKMLYKEEPVYSKQFKSVNVCFKNSLNTLVPNEFFEPELASKYLQNTIKVLKNDFIAFDELTEVNATNVYIPYVNIINYFLDLYGPFNYQHVATVLVNNLLQINKINGGTHTYVNCSKNELEVVVLSDHKLVLYNTHKITATEDFVYFLLFTYEQLGLNPEKDSLHLLGTIDEQSAYYQGIQKYIRNVSFLRYPYKYNADILNSISNHQQFVVLNQF